MTAQPHPDMFKPIDNAGRTVDTCSAFAETAAAPARAPEGAPSAPPAEPGGAPWQRDHRVNIARPISGRWVQVVYAVIDVCCIALTALVAFSVRFLPEAGATSLREIRRSFPPDFPWGDYGAFLLLYTALIVLCCHSQDLYRTLRTRTALAESQAVLRAVAMASVLLMAFLFLSGIETVSRLVLVFTGLQSAALLAAWRLWKREWIISRVRRGIGARNVVIVGAGKVGQALARYLEENKHLGLSFRGFLDQSRTSDPRLLGRVESLPQIARAEFVDEVVITIPSERELVKQVALEARRQQLDVKVVLELFDGMGWNASLEHVGEFPMMQLHREPIPALGLLTKRFIDIVGSASALLAFVPVMLILAVAIKLGSQGPVIYRSIRVGKKGRRFLCCKFRTMVANADALKADLRDRNERNGPFFKMADDPRLTRLGKFLRKYSLDELPQFWNVLKGEMSLVGPRPHPLDDYEQYSLEHLRRLDVKPGITGLWQVTARQDPSFASNLALDLEYIENWTLGLDLKILCRTIPVVLLGNGQ